MSRTVRANTGNTHTGRSTVGGWPIATGTTLPGTAVVSALCSPPIRVSLDTTCVPLMAAKLPESWLRSAGVVSTVPAQSRPVSVLPATSSTARLLFHGAASNST